MALTFQVVVDCHAPHDLADWWAETLGWVVEPQDPDFIRSMVEQGHATDAETTTHRGALVWREGAAIHPDVEPAPDRQRILFQLVPEGNMPQVRVGVERAKQTRMHLDLRGVGDQRDAIIASCLERGATKLWDGQQGPHTWVTLADPQGNEFCV